jgi:outer membrane lipoprotein-sorting protein
MRRLSARTRWAVPGGAVAIVGIGVGVAAVASAQSAPTLPGRTPEQLLAMTERAMTRPLAPLTATVQETSNLGLPAVPAAAASASPALALPASPTVKLWYLNDRHFRVAVPVRDGETDLRADGSTLWAWDSKTQTAIRLTLSPAGPGQLPSAAPGDEVPNPEQFARQLLKAVGPSTSVTVAGSVYVAGRAAYQLSIAPRGSGSLVRQILIAIDASRHIPLRVQVFASGQAAPVIGIGFTSLSFGPPAASNYTFTPPPGAKVSKEQLPFAALPGSAGSGLGSTGLFSSFGLGALAAGELGGLSGPAGSPAGPAGPAGAGTPPPGSMPAPPKSALRKLKAEFAKSLPPGLTKAQRAAAIRQFDQQFSAAQSGTADNGGGGIPGTGAPAAASAGASGQTVLGKDWLSVGVTPPSAKAASTVRQLLSGRPLSGVPGAAGPDVAALRAWLRTAAAVHGSWGSGWLLRTPLLSVLIESNGRFLFGAVTPAVLYADAARV